MCVSFYFELQGESTLTNRIRNMGREASLEVDDGQDDGEAGHVLEVEHHEEMW